MSNVFVATALLTQIIVASATKPTALRGGRLTAVPFESFRSDCGKRMHPVSLVQNVPGAGIDAAPGDTVLKDGYLEIDCIKDFLYYHGDKYGANRHEYKLGDITDVSIVHYTAHVASEDRSPMTHRVCFEFCRTVPNMGFFGIVNGHDCYCAPYTKAMAGDSSSCDAPCEGDTTTSCGGKMKSAVFSMHHCVDTETELGKAESDADAVAAQLDSLAVRARTVSGDMQSAATEFQTLLGDAGDTVAAGLMQQAKEFAGQVSHAGEEAERIKQSIASTKAKVQLFDFQNKAQAAEAEQIIAELEQLTAAGVAFSETLGDLLEQADPTEQGEAESQQYNHAMYFADKAFVDDTSTCGGQLSHKPIFSSDENHCALMCDKDIHECVGYNFYPVEPVGALCFLFSKVESVRHYTKCGNSEHSMCALKLSKFVDTKISPDPSGKCDRCLKSLEQADRCWA